VVHDYVGKQKLESSGDFHALADGTYTIELRSFEYLTPASRDRLVELILQNIDIYLERFIVMGPDRMEARKATDGLMSDMQRITEFDIRLFEFNSEKEFRGFSEDVSSILEEISIMDWSGMKGNKEFDSKVFIRNYVESKFMTLRQLLTVELIEYVETQVYVQSAQETLEVDSDYLASLDMGEFKKHTLLPAYDFDADTLMVDELPLFIEPEVETIEVPQGTDDRIIRLLESNNEMMSVFQEQMLVLQKELVEIKREGLDYQKEFQQIRSEIADIQLSIEEIRANNSAAGDRPLRPTSSENSVILFQKNSASLDESAELVLNKVYYRLMTSPEQKVMITGFADRSGNPTLNADISKSRAAEVNRYLLAKGIERDRLIMNHIGDTLSDSENPEDRKVEIAWLSE